MKKQKGLWKMKNKWAGIILGMAMSAFVLAGCSQSDTSDKNTETSENTIYGEITDISEGRITIDVGTRKEMEQKEETEEEQTSEDTKQEQPEEGEGKNPPSMLELTGETMEITVTEETEYKKQSMGGGPQGMGGTQKPEGEEAPEMPEGEEAPEMPEDGEAPEMPEGEEAPEMPENGEMLEEEEIALEDLQEGDTIAVTLNEDKEAEEIQIISMGMGGGGQMPGGGQAQEPEEYEAVDEYTEDTEITGETAASTGTDENAIHVLNGAKTTFTNMKITRNSQDSQGGDSSSFYGVGAALLVSDGTACVKDSTVDTDAAGGAGLFAYDSGSLYVSDTQITTSQDTSGGIHAAGGGKVYAWDLDVETNGESSAAIRSDRGGGTMVVDGGSYTTNGTGSPAVYCTADISVHNGELKANGSEAVCLEGLNSLRLFDCDVTGNMADYEGNGCTWNVILYQSMSGDSQEGNGTFQMTGGTLTGENGGMFYTTNTESTFILNGVSIAYPEENEFFLRCTGNSNERGWGEAGKNGADCHFTGIAQEMEGDVIWDQISKLDFYLTEGSCLKGAVIQDNRDAPEAGEGYANVYVDSSSQWVVTGDSTVSSLQSAGEIVDESGRPVTIMGTDGTVYVEGTSQYTVTTDSYEGSVDLTEVQSAAQWEEYQAEKPSELA